MRSDHYCMALLAHVDAGKTTLSESILVSTGKLRQAGRVDHGTSFLDTDTKERERGITIFSKQALFDIGEKHFTLIDTPGHTDFSAEAERVLSVLDFAVLIISAPDGVHGHDITLWKLLDTYGVPVFVFVNKMDQAGVYGAAVLKELEARFGQGFADLSQIGDPGGAAEFYEAAALLDERLLEYFLEKGRLEDRDISELIRERKLFPCCFGSALKNEGTDQLLEMIARFVPEKEYPDEFGARVYKVTRDRRGARLAHIRITGGKLKTRDQVLVRHRGSPETVTEKAGRILLFSGSRYEQPEEASAGMAVAVEGLDSAGAGDTLGHEDAAPERLMVPLFSSGVIPEDGTDIHVLYRMLKELEEEIPEIGVSFSEASGEIGVRLMGELQTDIVRAMVKERFDVRIGFTPASVVYRETLTAPVIGAGHYEPLRHYAEVHLLMEPAERGSGTEICSSLSTDVLPLHFQRLIMTNIGEKKHAGVLTGGELTDVRITLINARAHDKHTEGGDFREAVYRAVRQGLMKARAAGSCTLLEPYYDFELRVPDSCTGRAMTDLGRLAEHFEGPELTGGEAVFTGHAAVSRMQGYAAAAAAYSGGFASFHAVFGGYGPCADAAGVTAASGYEPEQDAGSPSGSVFCVHGAGYYVPWDQTDEYLHLDIRAEEAWLAKRQEGLPEPGDGSDAGLTEDGNAAALSFAEEAVRSAAGNSADLPPGKPETGKDAGRELLGAGLKADRELEEIFYRSLGGNRGKRRRDEADPHRRKGAEIPGRLMRPADAEGRVKVEAPKKQFLLVDGYNIIFAWKELKELAAVSIDAARSALQDILANYQGYRGMTLILVFDAYRIRGGRGSVEQYHNIYVVYTMEAQTADAYIEKTVHEIGHKHHVTVATSDGLEQTIVFGEGAVRMSAGELYDAVREANADIDREFIRRRTRLENRMDLERQN